MSQNPDPNHFHSVIAKRHEGGAWVVTVVLDDVVVETLSFPTEFAADAFVTSRAPVPVREPAIPEDAR